MTYWADNIKFIKDVLDSKYKKIEDALADVSMKLSAIWIGLVLVTVGSKKSGSY